MMVSRKTKFGGSTLLLAFVIKKITKLKNSLKEKALRYMYICYISIYIYKKNHQNRVLQNIDTCKLTHLNQIVNKLT